MSVDKAIFNGFDCEEYLEKYSMGFYHDASYLQLVLPIEDVKLNLDYEHLVIGFPGTDGIEFCYRKGFVDQIGVNFSCSQ
ncbi:hypothetical protein VV869_06610 [Photobacterium sp. MCCC 1A19761]|uniref:hypothetical protein n=1 Tax=Photobacterium sp. MCCC 1A19761 TaxID=3115000 RepID=UPI00307E85DB